MSTMEYYKDMYVKMKRRVWELEAEVRRMETRLAALELEARACTAEHHCGVCLALRGGI